MNIDTFRCLLELLVLPVLAGIWRLIARKPAPSPAAKDSADDEIAGLKDKSDRDGLLTIMEDAGDPMLSLDAAEALAELDDERGLDHLILALHSPDADEREVAVEILEGLNNARGNLALGAYCAATKAPPRIVSATPPASNPYTDPMHRQIFNELHLRETEDLEQIWQAHDTTQWQAAAFDVIGDILRQRLGQLPPRKPHAAPPLVRPADLPDDDMDPTIKELWTSGDFDRLGHIMGYENDWRLRLDAAEALARSGHESGLHYLIGALGSSEKDEQDMAAEILEGLDDPQGNAALSSRGGVSSPISSTPSSYEQVEDPEAPSEDLSPGDVWAEYRRKQQALADDMARKAPRSGDGKPS